MKAINIKNYLKTYKEIKSNLNYCNRIIGYNKNRGPLSERSYNYAIKERDELNARKAELENEVNSKFEENIKKAEGRATARTITGMEIIEIVSHINEVLDIPESMKKGITGKYTGGQKFPKAYKYRPESTHFEFEYRSSGCFITKIYRYTCPNTSKNIEINLTDEAKEAIITRTVNITI